MKKLIYTTAIIFPNRLSHYLITGQLVDNDKYSAKYILRAFTADPVGVIYIKYDKKSSKFIVTDFENKNWIFIRGDVVPVKTNVKFFKEDFVKDFIGSSFDYIQHIFQTMSSLESINLNEMIKYSEQHK